MSLWWYNNVKRHWLEAHWRIGCWFSGRDPGPFRLRKITPADLRWAKRQPFEAE